MIFRERIKHVVILFCLAVSLAGCAAPGDYYQDAQGKTQTNVWPNLRHNFKLDTYSTKPAVQKQIKWYMAHKAYLALVAKRGAPYIYYIEQQVKQRHLPSELVLLPIIESAYNPFNYSGVGAAGLWQFMPGTASGFSVRQDWWYDGRRDVFASTKAALDYMAYLNQFFNGDWLLTIAAYNSGEGTVDNAIKHNEKLGLPTDFWHLKLPAQTQVYVPKFLALATIVGNPDKYPIDWPPTPNAPYFTIVTVHSQMNLALAAQMAGISLKEFYQLNPGFNRWASDPDGPHRIVIPSDKTMLFKEQLKKLPTAPKVTWRRYVVQPGDDIGSIAKHHDTNSALVKKINDMSSNVIHVGQGLLIPANAEALSTAVINSVKHYIHNGPVLPGPRRVLYTVQKNDNLWTIAKAYNVSIRDLMFWNHMRRPEEIHAGKKLIIWTTMGTRDVIHYSSTIRPYLMYYSVEPGDSLQLIAKRYGLTVKQLQAANRLTSSTIRIGQRLVIPPMIHKLGSGHSSKTAVTSTLYKVKPGENLWTISKKLDVKHSQLMAWNGLTNKSLLHPGQKLTVYQK